MPAYSSISGKPFHRGKTPYNSGLHFIRFMHRFLQLLAKPTTALLLCLIAMAPLFVLLGHRGLNEPDEGRYSEMGREMLVTGDWLVPRLNGVPHYAKPAWVYWCIATSLKTFGINEWGARFPSLFAACVTLFASFFIAKRMAGPLAGFFSILVLSSSFLFFVASRLITPDMMLTSWVTLALMSFWLWWNPKGRNHAEASVSEGGWSSPYGNRLWLFSFFTCLGFAFFNKGPVSLGISFLTILGFLFFQKKLSHLKQMSLIPGLILTLAIALPWFLIMCKLNPDLWDFFLRGEIKDRVISGRGRVKQWHFFFWVLPLACIPWLFLAVSAVTKHVRWILDGNRLKPASQFLLCWIVFPFIMFTLSGSKLPTYILPLLVPVAILTGIWLSQASLNPVDKLPRWPLVLTWTSIPLMALAPWFLARKASPSIATSWIALTALLFILGLIILAAVIRNKNSYFITAIGCWISAILLFQVIIYGSKDWETELGHNSSWRTLSSSISHLDLVGVPIDLGLHPLPHKPVYERPGPRVAMYEFYDRSTSFYLMKNRAEVVPQFGGNSLWEIGRDLNSELKPTRDDLVALLKGPETFYVFTRASHLEELRKESGLELPIVKSASRGKYEVVLFTNGKIR
jgi:4-amino-4-deoxy-L-arabinose transferase-like glycosyltransferase